MLYNDNRKKARLQTVMPKKRFRNSPYLAGGGYFTFIVNAIKKIITRTITRIIYFLITTTSLPEIVRSRNAPTPFTALFEMA